MSEEGQQPRTAADVNPLPGGHFRLFVQKLGYQALMGMGVVQNPLTGEQSQDLARARSVVDDLVMLREKTRGNLDPDEEEHLVKVIGDLETHLASLDGPSED